MMGDDYEDMVKKYGASILGRDENLKLEKENRREVIFWGSVYGSEFSQMPDTALTSEAEYRKWCWKKTGMMPEKRGPAPFDKYVRSCMVMAATREVMPGGEYGVEVEDAIEEVLAIQMKSIKCLNAENWEQRYTGETVWVETVDPDRGEEIIVRINKLMKLVNTRESFGNTQGKFTRRDVIERVVYYGRQVAGREGSINRLRCTYALPITYLEGGEKGCGGFDGIHKPTKDPGEVVPFTTKRR
jgi:hypothetical protein